MISPFDSFLVQPPETASAAVWMGVLAWLSVCTLIRLPLLTVYVLSAGTSRRRALVLALPLALGIAVGTALLGGMTTPAVDGMHQTLQVSKTVFWALGACLIAAGVLFAGLINRQGVPEKWYGISGRLVCMELPGALLLGVVLGLLMVPACPGCRAGLLAVAEGGLVHHPAALGLHPLMGFAAGQGLVALGIGVLVGLLRPNLIAWLRTCMCSIEPRLQLLTGNLLIVLGIYFVVVG